MLKIPFDPSKSADQNFQVLVPEKVVLTLRLTWSVRASAWDVHVSADEKEIGMFRLVPRWPLLLEHKALSPISGDIIALPLSGNKDAELNEYKSLGNTWGLFWLSEEDVEDWRKLNGLG